MDKEILMICIADLGLAIRKNDIEGISIKCGTPAYVDPEVLNGNKFTVKSDIFSLGSLMFNLMTLKLLFRGKTVSEVLYRNKNECPKQMIYTYCSNFSIECIDLLTKMAERSSMLRPTAE
jgi:serine/threonine protein kinase